jgi:hypothetical protein
MEKKLPPKLRESGYCRCQDPPKVLIGMVVYPIISIIYSRFLDGLAAVMFL